jgi:hypothetical protein
VITRALLFCHAAHPCPTVAACEVTITRQRDGLALEYRLSGDMASLRIPAAVAHPEFADGLWQHTCMEVFIAQADGEGYREFNFSPSGCWAAYAFSAYRERDLAWNPAASPKLCCHTEAAGWLLQAWLPAELLPEGGNLRLGLSAVLETSDAAISYWALRHPGTKPDFHQRESFCLPLANHPDSDS